MEKSGTIIFSVDTRYTCKILAYSSGNFSLRQKMIIVTSDWLIKQISDNH